MENYFGGHINRVSYRSKVKKKKLYFNTIESVKKKKEKNDFFLIHHLKR